MDLRKWSLLATLAVAPAFPADPIRIKPGLWQMNYVSTVDGMMIPEATLQQMPPTRRAAIEAQMKKRAATPTRTTLKSCVTAEELAKGAFRPDPEADCRNTVVKQSATHSEVTFVCKDNEVTRTGRMVIDAPSDTQMKGTVDMSAPRGKVSVQIDGKWLGASCAGTDDR
jgi:hypothetical protein